MRRARTPNMILGERGFRQPALPPAGGIPGKSLNVPRGTSVVAVLYVYKCTRFGCKPRQRSGLVRFSGLRLRARQKPGLWGCYGRSFAIHTRSRCGVVRGCPVLSSHFSPGAAPQVGHRTASVCFGPSSFVTHLHLQKGRQLDQFRKPISVVYALLTTDIGRFCRKALISALFICKPPLYSTNPFFLNALINLLTLARVVPTISARVPWLTFRGFSGFDSFVICPNNKRTRASRFSLKLKN